MPCARAHEVDKLILSQTIPIRPKLTSSILSHSSQAKNDFLHSEPFHLGQNLLSPMAFLAGRNQLFPFQTIPFHSSQAKTNFLHSKLFDPVRPKLTSSIPSHSSLSKTYFRFSKTFQSSQNRFPSFQDIPVKSKPTSSIPSHSTQVKTNFTPFQTIPDRPKLPSSIPCHYSQVQIDFFHSKLFKSRQYCQ
jgi:hypothetical protein